MSVRARNANKINVVDSLSDVLTTRKIVKRLPTAPITHNIKAYIAMITPNTEKRLIFFILFFQNFDKSPKTYKTIYTK